MKPIGSSKYTAPIFSHWGGRRRAEIIYPTGAQELISPASHPNWWASLWKSSLTSTLDISETCKEMTQLQICQENTTCIINTIQGKKRRWIHQQTLSRQTTQVQTQDICHADAISCEHKYTPEPIRDAFKFCSIVKYEDSKSINNSYAFIYK